MSLLGTMMVRAGLLSDEQLAAVQAASAERKLSFVEALLAHGFADEDSVVGFLHSKLMIPKVGASVLDTVDRVALDRIPGELAARHAVLPISSDETGNLTLAMVDPTDMKAVDAISAHTGAYLVRAVAPLRVIRAAIGNHYGIQAPPLPDLQVSRAPAPAAVVAPAATAPVPSASLPANRAAVVAAPVVTAPVITAPVISAPVISAPVISAPVIGAPVVSPPVVAAPAVSPPIVAAPVLAPSAVPPAVAPPVAAPSVGVPAVVPRPASAPVVAAPPLVPPVAPAAAAEPPPVAAPVAAPAAAPAVVHPPGRPSAPSGAAVRPAAVLQPSAVIMPGPRPAAVLPATALAPSPYGIPPQAAAPVAPVPVAAPRPDSAPVPVARPASAPVAAAPVPAASFTPASAPVPAASFTPSPVPAASFTPASGNVTQPFLSGNLASTLASTPASAATPVPAASFTPAASAAQPFAAGGLLAAAAASAAASAPPAQPAAALLPVVDDDDEAEAELHRSTAPTMPVFSSGMATLRQVEPMDSSARAQTLPGIEAGDTLTGGSRPPDVVDIPLDDLDETDRANTLIPGEPVPREPTFDSAKTATWIPPTFGVANEIVPLSPEAFHRLLPRFATVKTRDEVTDLLLDFLAEGFSRVIMFIHVKGEIRGRDARGEDLLVEAVRQIRIPAGGPSMFSGVIERRAPYFGPMRTDTPIDAAFFSALGGVEGVVLVLPVLMRDKVPLLVFASGSSNPVDPRSLNELTAEVAAALERIIVVEKTRK